MEILKAEFIGSFPKEEICPKGKQPEYAFIGRSNVGKSSLINMLVDRKNLAHTSKQPGKTQYINYYLIDKNWHLVDLPGYGYAKISKKKRAEWKRMIYTYLERRDQLQCAMVLIDANVPPQKIDIEFMNTLGEKGIPFVIVYTKTDRLKPHQLEANIQAIQKGILEYWSVLPPEFITSANLEEGRDELLKFIDGVNTEYYSY